MTEQIRIMVIDDDALVCATLVENLRDCGFDVTGAEDGVEAFHLIATGRPPAIVITDIIMPRKEGLETILELRREHPEIKVIAISGSGSGRGHLTNFLEMAEKLGADAVLPKPIDIDLLEKTVRDLHACTTRRIEF